MPYSGRLMSETGATIQKLTKTVKWKISLKRVAHNIMGGRFGSKPLSSAGRLHLNFKAVAPSE